jgi:hypothetical protein
VTSNSAWKSSIVTVATELKKYLYCEHVLQLYYAMFYILNSYIYIYIYIYIVYDRVCGLVVRVLGYRSGDPGSIPGTSRKKK